VSFRLEIAVSVWVLVAACAPHASTLSTGDLFGSYAKFREHALWYGAVLQLSTQGFRYWAYYDVPLDTPDYPIAGSFSVSNGVVRLRGTQPDILVPSVTNGFVLLWTTNAYQTFRDTGQINYDGVLVKVPDATPDALFITVSNYWNLVSTNSLHLPHPQLRLPAGPALTTPKS
jgi:hypothetical protein